MLNILFGRISKLFMGSLNNATPLQLDNALWEYLLVAYPSKDVSDKIVAEKEIFYKKNEDKLPIKTRPHITIATFFAKQRMEQTLGRWIQNICNLQNSFTVALNNYSGFPPSALYVRVQTTEPFKKLANALKILDGFMESNDCPALKVVHHPHITFITGLSEYCFNNVMREYGQKTFHESFKVDRLILLKKDDEMRCDLINTFILPPPLALFD